MQWTDWHLDCMVIEGVKIDGLLIDTLGALHAKSEEVEKSAFERIPMRSQLKIYKKIIVLTLCKSSRLVGAASCRPARSTIPAQPSAAR